MNLADTLKRLSELLPERIFSDDGDYRVRLWNSRERILMRDGVPNNYGLMVLEQGLRLEIEARGWDWDVAGGPQSQSCLGTVWIHTPRRHPAFADHPAHALALALIDALEAEVKT